jgi:glyoxylate reductase
MTHICVVDPNIRPELLETIDQKLPEGWTASNAVAGATAILTENVDISDEMIVAAGDSLRLLVKLDTGTATVSTTTLPVIELPNTALVGVAELAVLMIMALSRHLFLVTRRTREQQWLPDRSEPILTNQSRYTYNWIGLEEWGTLYGKTTGIVGLGIIGRAIAARLRPFGMRLLYTQRTRLSRDRERQLGVEWRSLDELLSESDFVSLSHRFQEGPGGNDGHIGQRELALMKPTAYLINTARGRLVDENALTEALRDGTIAGAGLDVFRYEPLPADHPFFELAGDNLILTPHIAGAPVTEAWETIAHELIQNIERVCGA